MFVDGVCAVMVDYQAKYESLLRNVLSDLNTEVLTAQARAEKNAEGDTYRYFSAIFSPSVCFYHAASAAYCTELKTRLREWEREVEASRKEVTALREELTCAHSQLAEARAKLEIYAEREKLPKAIGREHEQVKAFESPKHCL